MCDYSLAGLPNRLAVEGEELVLFRFPTDSIGLAPVDQVPGRLDAGPSGGSWWRRMKRLFAPACECGTVTAVCIPPGASLLLMEIPPSVQRRWGLKQEETAIFVQTSAEVNTYRDALHFQNGRETLLQNLPEGLRLKVVSLGGDSAREEDPALTADHRGRY